eukprot:GHUV01014964.1.p1 GENE.GHUV01014964.1~~GHUV01014964.1.p1  ORF type:complete len:891 (+),score=167.30 GHUV01014964.1:456-3128(+)
MASRLGTLLVVLLVAVWTCLCYSGVDAKSSKYACEFSNRLCQWQARYAFGAAVIGDMAFFHGGILSNDPTTPVNNTAFEVLDLRTMAPYVMEVEENRTLATTRYRHHLVVWRGKILAVGGQQDDASGASQHVINVLELDINRRRWQLLKQFTQPGGAVAIIFDAAVVAGGQLLVVFQSLDPAGPQRMFLSLDLNSKEVEHNYNLGRGTVQVLDWPHVGILARGKDGNHSHLVVQSKRSSTGDKQAMFWFEVTGKGVSGVEGPLRWTAATTHKQLPGGKGGMLLWLSPMRIIGQPTLVAVSSTAARFSWSKPQGEKVLLVAVFAIMVSGPPDQRAVHLALTSLMMMLPFGRAHLKGLQSADVPLLRNIELDAADVTALPYVGDVDLLSELHSSNVLMQEWPEKGFIIRGSGLADYRCQRLRHWQPFVIQVDLSGKHDSSVRCVSSNTWCATYSSMLTASKVVKDSAALESGAGLHLVEDNGKRIVLAISGQRRTNPGGQLVILDETAPLLGAMIDIADNSATDFEVSDVKGYTFPLAVATCTLKVAGYWLYVEYGGWHYDDQGTTKTNTGLFTIMTVPPQHNRQAMQQQQLPGVMSGAAWSALACASGGTIYLHGGLDIARFEPQESDYDLDGKPDWSFLAPVWGATDQLYYVKVSESDGSYGLGSLQHLSKIGMGPAARSGHSLTLLPASITLEMGMAEGALLLYGGSNTTEPQVSQFATNTIKPKEMLADVALDTRVWLYDLARDTWAVMKPSNPADAPPGLMHHRATFHDKQLIIFGGYKLSHKPLSIMASPDMYILDFTEQIPRWRKAPTDNLEQPGTPALGYPNSGVVPLPHVAAVALMSRSKLYLAPMPQTWRFLQTTSSSGACSTSSGQQVTWYTWWYQAGNSH